MIRLVISILFFVGAWLLFANFTNPTFASIDALRAEGARLDVALTKANELRAERTKLSSKFNLFSEEEKDRLEKFLPESVDNVRLLIDIDRIADAHGLQISTVTIQQNTVSADVGRGEQGGYGVAVLTFGVTASYEVFLEFLNDLERSLRLIDVTEIAFASSDNSALMTYSLKIQTYWLSSTVGTQSESQ